MGFVKNLLGCALTVLLVSIGSSIAQTTTPSPIGETQLLSHYPLQVRTKCGEVLNCSRNGGIFYKPTETVSSNERCAWIISIPHATGYKLSFVSLGYWPVGRLMSTNKATPEYQVIVSEFNRGRAPTHSVPISTGHQMVFQNASALVITFYTTQLRTSYEGFVLQYEALFNSSKRIVNALSENFVIGTNNYQIKYPTNPYYYSSYQNKEMSMFLFAPPDNTFRPGVVNKIIYGRVNMEGNCNDYLKVYKFDPVTHWNFVGRICGTIQEELISSEDLILVVFETNDYNAYQGFRLSYASGLR